MLKIMGYDCESLLPVHSVWFHVLNASFRVYIPVTLYYYLLHLLESPAQEIDLQRKFSQGPTDCDARCSRDNLWSGCELSVSTGMTILIPFWRSRSGQVSSAQLNSAKVSSGKLRSEMVRYTFAQYRTQQLLSPGKWLHRATQQESSYGP